MFSRRTPRQNRGRVGGFGISFKPTQLPGLVLWLRADLGISIGTGVSAWADQSGNGHNATQLTGSKQPTYNASDAGYGGRPTLSFLSSSAQFLSAAGTLAQPYTYVVVGESDDASISGGFSDGNGGCLYAASHVGSGVASVFAGSILTSSAAVSSKSVIAGTFNGASSNIYVNNSQTGVMPGNAGTNAVSTFYVGGAGVIVSGLTGKLAEYIVYSNVPTAAQMKQLFAYLGARYGIAVS